MLYLQGKCIRGTLCTVYEVDNCKRGGPTAKTSLRERSLRALTVSFHGKMERSEWSRSHRRLPLGAPFSFHSHLASCRPDLSPPTTRPPCTSASHAEAGSLRQAVTRVLMRLWRDAPGQGLLRVPVTLCRQAALPAQVGSQARGGGGSEQTLASERSAGRAGGREIYGLCTLSGSRAPRQNYGAPRAPEAESWGRSRHGHVWCPRVSAFCRAQARNSPGGRG